MRYISTKNAADIQLEGINVELEVVGDNVEAIRLTDRNGSLVQIAKRDWNSIRVEIPAPPKRETKYRLEGSVLGLPVSQDFDKREDAQDAQRRFERDASESALEITSVQVAMPDPTVQNAGEEDLPF